MNKDEAKAMIEALGAMASDARYYEHGADEAARIASINETEAALKTMLQNAALIGGPSADETIGVRVAVAMAADGSWAAAGAHVNGCPISDELAMGAAKDDLQSGIGDGLAVAQHIVEARVPRPKVETVKGTVVS